MNSNYNLLISKIGNKQLKSLEKEQIERIKTKLKELKNDPFGKSNNLDIKQLHGAEPITYRLRIGDYRVIYRVFDKEIRIARILRRNKAYQFLE